MNVAADVTQLVSSTSHKSIDSRKLVTKKIAGENFEKL